MNEILVITRSKLDEYKRLLEAARLSDATFYFADSPTTGMSIAATCNIWFGSPSMIAPLLKEGLLPQWIQSMWAGIEPFVQPDMPTGYTLTNMRGIFNALIAEYAVGHIFSHALNYRQHLSSQSEQRWNPLWPQRVAGKRVGILGVGEIGGEVARLCRAVGLTVWGYTRTSEGCPYIDRYFHGEGLGEMAEGVDFLISIMPNTPASSNLLNRDIFKRMKSTALLINAGRGSAIVDDSLLWAL
ncbi:MAG: NAD(P)-dependent oxidoreductase, partial [Chloroflexota bacterium]